MWSMNWPNTWGVKSPDNLVAGLDYSFFVTPESLWTVNGQLQGSSLFICLPLCRIMNQAELQAVIVHELAHFRGEDTEFGRRFNRFIAGR